MAVCNFSDLIVLLVPTSFFLILTLILALMMVMMMMMMMMMMPESQRVPTILMIKQDKMNLEHSYSYYIIYIHQTTNEQTVKNMPKKT